MPKPEVEVAGEARVGLVAFGSSHWAIVESRDQLRKEAGLVTSYLRLKAYPFPESCWRSSTATTASTSSSRIATRRCWR